ncbi:flagellar brake protein [Egibacter rhizosphaerae]|nr:PilZ domain-containing protein [Egibacter rhizosphaerae]
MTANQIYPEINERVELARDEWDGPARSRVEDTARLADGTMALVVSAPRRAGSGAARAGPGDVVEITWANERGLCCADAELIAAEEEPVPTWALALPRGPEIVQRRDAVRVPVTVWARLLPADRAEGDPLPAQLADLSETGARIRRPDGATLVCGDHVTLVVSTEEGEIELSAEVVREDRETGDAPLRGYGLAFRGIPRPAEDRLRRHLISLQLAQRGATPAST